MKTKTTKKPEYSITLTIGDDVYNGTGETALEALQSIPKPLKIMNKVVFSITDGVKKREVLMWPLRAKRLFYNKLFQEIQLKALCSGMK